MMRRLLLGSGTEPLVEWWFVVAEFETPLGRGSACLIKVVFVVSSRASGVVATKEVKGVRSWYLRPSLVTSAVSWGRLTRVEKSEISRTRVRAQRVGREGVFCSGFRVKLCEIFSPPPVVPVMVMVPV